MVDVVQALQSSIEIVKRLRALSKKIEDADFKMLLADLSGELADAKMEVASLKAEIARLSEENQSLSSRLQQKTAGKPIFKDGAYSFEGDEGAYCTACYDVRNQRVRLSKLLPPFDEFGKWECPSCKAILN
jgi:chromosome segregation ATPase